MAAGGHKAHEVFPSFLQVVGLVIFLVSGWEPKIVVFFVVAFCGKESSSSTGVSYGVVPTEDIKPDRTKYWVACQVAEVLGYLLTLSLAGNRAVAYGHINDPA